MTNLADIYIYIAVCFILIFLFFILLGDFRGSLWGQMSTFMGTNFYDKFSSGVYLLSTRSTRKSYFAGWGPGCFQKRKYPSRCGGGARLSVPLWKCVCQHQYTCGVKGYGRARGHGRAHAAECTPVANLCSQKTRPAKSTTCGYHLNLCYPPPAPSFSCPFALCTRSLRFAYSSPPPSFSTEKSTQTTPSAEMHSLVSFFQFPCFACALLPHLFGPTGKRCPAS